jgi:endonuclease/exonuclease/phosphatase family metal-dependent hydrolase
VPECYRRSRSERQVALLAGSRELKSLSPDVACLVGGDFNDWRSRLAPLFMEQTFRSATDHSASGERPLATFPSFFPRGPLDRVYYRGPLRLLSAHRCRLRLSRVASDHLPVVADFEID